MIVPDWLRNQDNVFLLIVLLLLLWLWLLVYRRQEEERSVPERPIALTVDDLGRKAFICGRSNDIYLYRGLFINGMEARELLGDMAKEYLEKRNLQVLTHSLQTLHDQISKNATYVGLGTKEGTKLVIRIKVGTEEKNLSIGSVTQIGNSWRLLQPPEGIA